MKAHDFYAVAFDGAVYCNQEGCLPCGATEEETAPIFADSEWDSYPTCDSCQTEHDYVCLTTEGQRWLVERNGPEEEDITTEDHRRFFQGGKQILDLDPDLTVAQMWAQLDAHMDRECFSPNVWWISDHGNPHLMQRPKQEGDAQCSACLVRYWSAEGHRKLALCPRCK